MIERSSNQHGPRLDDEMDREVESLTRGAPVEARVDENRALEDAGDGEPVPESVLLEADDTRERSDLARHLRPSIFPADVDTLVQCAREEFADEVLIVALSGLPARTYATTNEVWVALGGSTEHRDTGGADEEAEAETPEAEAPQAGEDTEEPEPAATAAPAFHRFNFNFDWRYRIAALPFGITPGRAFVEVDERAPVPVLRAHFGLWSLETPLANIAGVERTGPYALPKTLGPAHISLRDRGLTFATTSAAGLCIEFREPVPAADPIGVLRHPALTVTVDDVEGLESALSR